jgi:transposase-like protein
MPSCGLAPDGRRRILGGSCELLEAESDWRGFLDGLVNRGMRGVRFVVSDDHAGLRAARQAVLPGVL